MPSPDRRPIRRAQRADHRPVAATLSRAFFDDPVMSWLLPDPSTRAERQLAFYRAELTHAHANGLVLTSPGHEGAALWLAPRRWRMGTAALVRQGPAAIRSFGRRLPVALKLQTAMEDAHPREEHWYLAILGTDPAHQGGGVGAALITAVTERCDETGQAAYLESSKPANVPYYERFGFRVTGEIQVADSPVLFSMWRDPA